MGRASVSSTKMYQVYDKKSVFVKIKRFRYFDVAKRKCTKKREDKPITKAQCGKRKKRNKNQTSIKEFLKKCYVK